MIIPPFQLRGLEGTQGLLHVQDIIQTGVSHSDRIARQQLAQELRNLLASEPSSPHPPSPPNPHSPSGI
jgi:hypothetical protein